MLIAYLRGLLLPDYPNGIRSIVRENFILQAINREIGAEEILNRIKVEGAFVPMIADGTKANMLLKQHDKMLSLAYENFNHNQQNKKNKFSKYNLSALDKFIEDYKTLERQGLVGEIKK